MKLFSDRETFPFVWTNVLEIQKGCNTCMLNVIELELLGNKVQCTLFDNYVDDLNNFIASGDIQNAIVIILLVKAKHFQDKLHVQNCLNCTRVMFNPTCADGDSVFVVLGTIKRVVNKENFWYTACVCSKAIQEGQMAHELAALMGKTFLFKVETKAEFSPHFE
ncbi:hypothetical protein MTR_4g060910 [Medicago truncatula]|uniref:Nucleic acid-binding protein n=1 Tax=Medicago truncatula TaxID=3880 RepID=G7JRG4_MEDTR|nr:hypothetical protein MTR_4g060910 [Medicago truncatula]